MAQAIDDSNQKTRRITQLRRDRTNAALLPGEQREFRHKMRRPLHKQTRDAALGIATDRITALHQCAKQRLALAPFFCGKVELFPDRS